MNLLTQLLELFSEEDLIRLRRRAEHHGFSDLAQMLEQTLISRRNEKVCLYE